MKLLHRKTKQAAARTGIVPLRLIAYILHATTLDRFYKPRLLRDSPLLTLDEAVLAKLPRHSQTFLGGKLDPMNLIFVGTDRSIRQLFKRAGWSRANPSSPLHWIYNGLTILFGRYYSSEPFMPHFVSIGLQDFAYQKKLRRGTVRERHHLRIWRTNVVLPGDKLVWVGTCSYDTTFKVQLTPPFIHHRIDPNIDAERDFIVEDLVKNGVIKIKSVSMNPPVLASAPLTHAHGNAYFTDGQAVVMEVLDEA